MQKQEDSVFPMGEGTLKEQEREAALLKAPDQVPTLVCYVNEGHKHGRKYSVLIG